MSRAAIASVLALAALPASACRRPDPAPETLEDLLLFTFSHYPVDDATHASSLADAAQNLRDWYLAGEPGWEEPERGWSGELLERLSDSELSALDEVPPQADPEACVGIVVARRSPCTLSDIDRLFLNDAQDELFPDDYESYVRRRQSGYECLPGGDCVEATWTSDIVKVERVILTDVTYDFSLDNGLRRVDATPPGAVPSDEPVDARVARAWMTDEATLSPDNIARFIQNYQLEILVPEGSGLLHFYAQWTHVESGEINTEAGVFLDEYIEGLHAYMDQLDAHCEAG
jgi:hypothetical protein